MPSRKLSQEPTERLTITLEAADRAELERLARQEDRSLSWIVREAIRRYIDKSREEKPSGDKVG